MGLPGGMSGEGRGWIWAATASPISYTSCPALILFLGPTQTCASQRAGTDLRRTTGDHGLQGLIYWPLQPNMVSSWPTGCSRGCRMQQSRLVKDRTGPLISSSWPGWTFFPLHSFVAYRGACVAIIGKALIETAEWVRWRTFRDSGKEKLELLLSRGAVEGKGHET